MGSSLGEFVIELVSLLIQKNKENDDIKAVYILAEIPSYQKVLKVNQYSTYSLFLFNIDRVWNFALLRGETKELFIFNFTSIKLEEFMVYIGHANYILPKIKRVTKSMFESVKVFQMDDILPASSQLGKDLLNFDFVRFLHWILSNKVYMIYETDHEKIAKRLTETNLSTALFEHSPDNDAERKFETMMFKKNEKLLNNPRYQLNPNFKSNDDLKIAYIAKQNIPKFLNWRKYGSFYTTFEGIDPEMIRVEIDDVPSKISSMLASHLNKELIKECFLLAQDSSIDSKINKNLYKELMPLFEYFQSDFTIAAAGLMRRNVKKFMLNIDFNSLDVDIVIGNIKRNGISIFLDIKDPVNYIFELPRFTNDNESSDSPLDLLRNMRSRRSEQAGSKESHKVEKISQKLLSEDSMDDTPLIHMRKDQATTLPAEPDAGDDNQSEANNSSFSRLFVSQSDSGEENTPVDDENQKSKSSKNKKADRGSPSDSEKLRPGKSTSKHSLDDVDKHTQQKGGNMFHFDSSSESSPSELIPARSNAGKKVHMESHAPVVQSKRVFSLLENGLSENDNEQDDDESIIKVPQRKKKTHITHKSNDEHASKVSSTELKHLEKPKMPQKSRKSSGYPRFDPTKVETISLVSDGEEADVMTRQSPVINAGQTVNKSEFADGLHSKVNKEVAVDESKTKLGDKEPLETDRKSDSDSSGENNDFEFIGTLDFPEESIAQRVSFSTVSSPKHKTVTALDMNQQSRIMDLKKVRQVKKRQKLSEKMINLPTINHQLIKTRLQANPRIAANLLEPRKIPQSITNAIDSCRELNTSIQLESSSFIQITKNAMNDNKVSDEENLKLFRKLFGGDQSPSLMMKKIELYSDYEFKKAIQNKILQYNHAVANSEKKLYDEILSREVEIAKLRIHCVQKILEKVLEIEKSKDEA